MKNYEAAQIVELGTADVLVLGLPEPVLNDNNGEEPPINFREEGFDVDRD
jgi:hypothetical protein